MTSIIYVGMDVHTTNYTLCSYSIESDKVFATTTLSPDYKNIVKYVDQVKMNHGEDCHILCGYEAGCLGYSLYNQLIWSGVDCVILAPTTMAMTKKKGIKTDKRDAGNIAKCLAYNTYSSVYVPTEEDNSVKEYIRMRDDVKDALKRIKQELLAFCTRNGQCFTEGKNYWTQKHIAWLKKLNFSNAVLQETLQEYITLYHQMSDKVELFDKRINELACTERYAEKVKKLSCFIGIKAHTALATIVETGDFARFPTAQQYASYLGLVPGENSSGNSIRRTGITKAGNSHVRKLLVESAQSYSRGAVGAKGKALKDRQAGNDPKVIAYADKANVRLKRKFYRIMFNSKRNIAVTAVARELACFIWGMMTDNIALELPT
jgi:Transposase and inactivated derivatives